MSGIYKISSISNPKKCYIGSSINIIKRWRVHLSNLKYNKHGNNKLQNHYNKYGLGDLVFLILLECEANDLVKTEQCFLDVYKPFFNILKIADRPLGHKLSEETKQRMRHPKSEEGRKNIRENHVYIRGKDHYLYGKTGINHPRYNKHHSEKTKQRLREASTGNKNALGHTCIAWNKGKKLKIN